jgi:hypothetical protein
MAASRGNMQDRTSRKLDLRAKIRCRPRAPHKFEAVILPLVFTARVSGYHRCLRKRIVEKMVKNAPCA